VALLIDRFCEPADQRRLLPRIYTEEVDTFFTGAMFLTEKVGGSDVGANLVEARDLGNGFHSLHGEKWFCSNVNADIVFALARTNETIPGTRGLSIFLVEKHLENGERNPIDIVRLKDKLGTRSMASGECLLNGTIGKMVGPEFQGFRVMTEMINLSRMYNSVAAVAGGRRALIEAYQFLSFRQTFGKNALEHALVRDKFWELGSRQLASFVLVWRAIEAMDNAEAGNADEAELLRLLTPMAKRESAETAVYVCRESMELMGGMGYIEEGVIPKTMRDVMVLPIWEGAGNIMILDMLRAITKSRGLDVLVQEIERLCDPKTNAAEGRLLEWSQNLQKALADLPNKSQDEFECLGKSLMMDLTTCYQVVLLGQHFKQSGWLHFDWAARWMTRHVKGLWTNKLPPSVQEIQTLLAWDF
jgi:acyl-CoA dehydrogenase